MIDVNALVERWRHYAHAGLVHAGVDQDHGETFGAELHRVRARVRREAADLLARDKADPEKAARTMHRKARERWIHHWPLLGYDEAAVDYTVARTWQDCARAIDPALPEVQPKLTE